MSVANDNAPVTELTHAGQLARDAIYETIPGDQIARTFEEVVTLKCCATDILVAGLPDDTPYTCRFCGAPVVLRRAGDGSRSFVPTKE